MNINGIMVRDFKATATELAAAGIATFRERFGVEPVVIFVGQRDTSADLLDAVRGVEVRHVRWIRPHNVFVSDCKDGW